MAITTRQTSATGVTNKGAPLTNAEVDANFIELRSQVFYVKAAEAIAKGDVVYASGAVGASGSIEVSKYIANNTIEELYVLGVSDQALAKGEFGNVKAFGEIQGIATDGAPQSETWVDGTVLYASPTTAGTLTNVEPSAPNQVISVAMVVASHGSNGTLFVRPNSGYHLHELHDVSTTVATNGQLLMWNDAGYWEPADAPVALPDQTGSDGLFLTTDGTTASWAEVTGGISYVRKTANYTAVDQEGIIADTTSGTFTITLPASPEEGATVIISDGANFEANNLIVGRNGSTIEGDAEDLTLDIAGVSVTFVYDGSTWQFYTQTGVLESGARELGALSDVTLTSPALNEVLAYNGSEWVNTTPVTGSFPFYKADSTSDTIPLTADSAVPFFDASGSSKDISLVI
jgi:hypothetical protein